MATFVHKPGSFSLFRNIRKPEGSKQPDYAGPGRDVDGNEIEVSAWIQEGKQGKFMSCQMKPKVATQPPPKAPAYDPDSDVPF